MDIKKKSKKTVAAFSNAWDCVIVFIRIRKEEITMTVKTMSVSLDEFVKYLLKKWIVIALCIVFCTSAAAVGAKVCGNEFVVPASENYEDLKTQEAYFEEYIANSIVMEMNPLEVYERTIFINHVSDRNTLKDYVESGQIWKNYETEISTSYLVELITWQEWENSGCSELKIQHSEENGCEELSLYIEKEIKQFDENSEVTVGQQRTVIDESISDVQMWYTNRLRDVKGQLEYTASGCVIGVSNAVAAVFGALSGGFIGTVICFSMFFFKMKEQ